MYAQKLREKANYWFNHRFVRNTATLQAGSMFGNVLQALAGIVIARILQPELFGIYALAFGLAGLISLFMGVGAQDAVTTIVGESYAKQDREATKEAFSFLAKITIIMGLVALIGALFAPLLAKIFYHNYKIGIYASVVVVASIISTTFYSFSTIGLQIVDRIKAMTWIGVGDQLTRTGLALTFVLFGFGVPGIVFGHLIGAIIISIISYRIWKNLKKEHEILPSVRELWQGLRKVSIKKYIGFSFWIALDRNLSNLYNILPVVLLGIYVTASQVTFFKLAFGYLNLALGFIGPIGILLNVEFPRMKALSSERLPRNFIRVSLYSLGLSALLTGSALIVAPLAFKIVYGASFMPSVIFVYGLAIYGAQMGFGVGLGSMLRAINKVKFSVILHTISLAVGIPVGLLLIKNLGGWGAVIIVTSWYLMAHTITFFYLKKQLNKIPLASV